MPVTTPKISPTGDWKYAVKAPITLFMESF
jgi:hypothetical protein